MWQRAVRVINVENGGLSMGLDCVGGRGFSGSPIWRNDPTKGRWIVGVWTHLPSPGSNLSSGCRLTGHRASVIADWRFA
jgi:hypothetical protein